MLRAIATGMKGEEGLLREPENRPTSRKATHVTPTYEEPTTYQRKPSEERGRHVQKRTFYTRMRDKLHSLFVVYPKKVQRLGMLFVILIFSPNLVNYTLSAHILWHTLIDFGPKRWYAGTIHIKLIQRVGLFYYYNNE
jgi:hypothetical protein